VQPARAPAYGGRPQTPMEAQSPQIAKVMPRLDWMLTKSVCPSGLKADPANSSLPEPITFLAMENRSPSVVSPRRKLPSSW
jgi:hypothetical protein